MGSNWEPIGNAQSKRMSKQMRVHGFASGYDGLVGKEHPLYRVWRHVKERCYSENDQSYSTYGARGIRVCDDWHDSNIFITWCLDNGWAEGLQIDRIDNDGDYRPENCRFVTPKGNANNRRSCIWIEFNGERLTLMQAVERYGKTSYDSARARYHAGWSIEDLLLMPKSPGRHYQCRKDKSGGE